MASAAVESADVVRFYEVFDRANGMPDPERLQADYLDRGSEGLKRLAQLRRITGTSLAEAIGKNPQIYAAARVCAGALDGVTRDVRAAAAKLHGMIPESRIPTVTIAIGRSRPVAVGEARGAYVGLEALCAWTVPDADFRRRAVNVITHELIHTQQRGLAEQSEAPTVLHASLVEGAAEFVTELVTGSVAYRHLATGMKGRELELERAFLADIDRPAIGSRWVFNDGATTQQPSDLGYRIGYRIAKSYYRRAADRTAALRAILHIDDAHGFLKSSGWTPGMTLP